LHLEQFLRVKRLEGFDELVDFLTLSETVSDAAALIIVETVKCLRLHCLNHLILRVFEVSKSLPESGASGSEDLVGQGLLLGSAHSLQILQKLVKTLVFSYLFLDISGSLEHPWRDLSLDYRFMEALHVEVVVCHCESSHQFDDEVK
jgi:hypothetical protein